MPIVHHYAPRFATEGHTITALAAATAQQVSDDTFGIVRADQLSMPFDRPWVAHLGNNPQSLPLLNAAWSAEAPGVLVLHDVVLFSLADAWGRQRGIDGFTARVLVEATGPRGVKWATGLLGGTLESVRERADLMKAVLTTIVPPQHHVVFHTADTASNDAIAAAFPGRWTRSEMPLRFHDPVPNNPQDAYAYDITLSGSGNFARRIDVIWPVLEERARADQARIAIVGSIATFLREHYMTEDPPSSVHLYPRVSTAWWNELHRSARVGIRLGVGSLGECSGVVRDYLNCGMVVVTDEESHVVRSAPGVVSVPRSATQADIASALAVALDLSRRTPDRMPHGVEHQVADYANALRQVLARITS